MEQGQLSDLTDDMWHYFIEKVASSIKQIQNATNPVETVVKETNTTTLDIFAEELLDCINGIPIHQVC